MNDGVGGVGGVGGGTQGSQGAQANNVDPASVSEFDAAMDQVSITHYSKDDLKSMSSDQLYELIGSEMGAVPDDLPDMSSTELNDIGMKIDVLFEKYEAENPGANRKDFDTLLGENHGLKWEKTSQMKQFQDGMVNQMIDDLKKNSAKSLEAMKEIDNEG